MTTPSDTSTDVRPKLYFEYGRTRPALDTLEVKTVHPDELCGRPAVFTIIGESHYVGLPRLGFHELCSCKPLSTDPTYETSLSTAVDREFHFGNERLDATTVVRGQPIDAFPDPNEATVAYRFGPRAWTSVTVDGGGYETYHTYPEYELALHTATTITAATTADSWMSVEDTDSATSDPTTEHNQ